VEVLARVGYVVRGSLYVTVGVLAVAVAVHAGGATTTPRGAIGTIGTLPFGRALLVLTAIGLAGYGLWGFVRALFDPLHRGSHPAGLAQRCGYLASGWSYCALVVPTVQLILNPGHPAGGSPAGGSAMAGVLAMPAGPWLVGAAGVIWFVGAGLGQLYQAYTASFRRDFESWQMGAAEIQWATRFGRVGLAARGVVFSLIGVFLVQAAVHADALRAKGIDGALQTLAAQPHGQALLGIAAAGLVCFGLFSFCCARWIRMR
jgi:hypothetical protein